MIRHILLFKFRAQVTSVQIEQVRNAFEAIPQKIVGVDAVEWGLNDSPEGLNKGYDYAVLMTFRDEEARRRYLPHVEHEALKEIFVPLLDDIVVFDYSVD